MQKAHDTPTPALTKSSLQQFVVSLRQRGVKPVSCNTYIKVEQRIIQTLTDEQLQLLLMQKPKRFDHWRLHALVCVLLDVGLHIEEALTLRRA